MRAKYHTRSILLIGDSQAEAASKAVLMAPRDGSVEVVIREPVKARGLDANAAMWAGPLKDIAEQAYVEGKAYPAEIWHEHYKLLYLPDEFDPELCLEGYVKWGYGPFGDRFLIGSTTQLTKKGFSQYLQQVEADGASMGVLFSANPRAA